EPCVRLADVTFSHWPERGSLSIPFLTSAVEQPIPEDSLDKLIRAHEKGLGNRHAESVSCLHVDDQLEPSRLFHGQVGGLGAFQDLVHETGGAPEHVGNVRSVRHETSSICKLSRPVYGREPFFSARRTS